MIREHYQNLDSEVIKDILAIPEDVADQDDIIELFRDEYIPGTFMISERKNRPQFILSEDNLEYTTWVKKEVGMDLESIKHIKGLDVNIKKEIDVNFEKIQNEVVSILELQLSDGNKLKDVIAHQEYPDVFRRIISMLLTKDPETVFNTYEDLKKIGKIIACDIIKRWGDKKSLYDYLKASLASGLIGLDMKRYATAVSKIYDNSIIPLKYGDSFPEKIFYVKKMLENKIGKEMGIDFWLEYKREVLDTGREIYIASFTDDFIETIFQMKFFEKQLEYNSKLTIHVIPRYSCYGNDISYQEVLELLNERIFYNLKRLYNSGRFLVCRNGPKMGVVNGNKISSEVASILKKSDIVEVKGARSYESLQGIRKITYFGFAVCREISESITGINAELGQLVFIRQDPGMRSFEDFRYRAYRKCSLPLGRSYGLAKMTAKEYSIAIKSKNYASLVEHFGDREITNRWIMQEAKKEKKTFAEIILQISF